MNVPAGERLRHQEFPWRLAGVVSVLALELTIVIAWIRLLAAPRQGPPGWVLLVWFLGLAWLARSLALAAAERSWSPWLSMGLSTIGIVAGLLLSVNLYAGDGKLLDLGGAVTRVLAVAGQGRSILREISLLLVVVFAWRRGVAAASSDILSAKRTGFKFRLGTLLFAALLLVRGQAPAPPVPDLLPLFFLASLMAMSLTRAQLLSREPGVGRVPFSAQWLAGLLALFLVTLAVGVAAGLGLASEFAQRALDGLRRGILFAIYYLILLPLLVLLSPLLNRVGAIVERWMASYDQAGPLELEPDFGGVFTGSPPLLEQLERWAQELRPYLPTVGGVLLAVAAAAIILWGASVVRRRREAAWDLPASRDRGEGLADASPLADLRRRWEELGRDLGSWGRAALAGRLRTALIVRRLYRRLLALGAEKGRPRRPWQTPWEYAHGLGEQFPAGRRPINELTQAYVQVRYGELPETEDTIRRVQRAWDDLRRILI